MAVHDSRNVERWRTIVAAWRSSGLSVTAFCQSQGVNKSGLHRWRNILDQLDRPATTPAPPSQPKPRPKPRPKSSPSFVPLRVLPDALIEVILPSGIQFRVPLSADARQLARLVLALASPPC